MAPSAQSDRVAIVGAGVMGRTLAWQLLRDANANNISIDLTIFDRDAFESGTAAAYTAAGMLTPYCEVESAESDIFDLGIASLELWPGFAQSLEGDIDFRQSGSLVIAHKNDRAEYLRFKQRLLAKMPSGAAHVYQDLNRTALFERSPDVADHFDVGLYIANESSVDSALFMKVIGERLREKGLNWYAQSEVKSIQQSGDTARVDYKIDNTEHSEQFDHVIDCRGLAAKDNLKDLRGVRGEVITLYAPEVEINTLIRLMHPRYRLYLVPRKNSIYLIGATQIESEDFSNVSVKSALELLSAVYSIHSGFAEARILKMETNCRPALKNNLPKIQRNGRIISINGLFRHGYLLSPLLAKEASASILGLDVSAQFDILFNQ